MPFTGGTKLKDGRTIENSYTSGTSSHDKDPRTSNNPEYRVKKPGGGFEYVRGIQGKDVEKK